MIETLVLIVTNTNQNHAIGLFGSWGTGKSTIVGGLQRQLLNSKIPLVIFDVWKHEGDGKVVNIADEAPTTLYELLQLVGQPMTSSAD